MRLSNIARYAALTCALLFSQQALADNDYHIGLSGSLTGPAAGTYAPAVAGLKLYIDNLNANGGIKGHKVQLEVMDDSGQPSRAAVNAQRLTNDDDLLLLINSSLSSTYAPMIRSAQRSRTPMLFAGSVCPKEVFPPAQAGLYCTTSYGPQYDSRAALNYIQEQQSGQAKIGFSAMSIPISRGEIDYAETYAKQLGMQVTGKQAVPPPTADYTPVGTALKSGNPDWVYSWAPWVTQVKTFEAMRRVGWQGDYISYAHLEAEDELKRLKDPKFVVLSGNAFVQEKLPAHEALAKAAKKHKVDYPTSQLVEGWVAGMAVEAALSKGGWPIDRTKLQAAMGNLHIDTKGLRGAPIEWNGKNHFRTKQAYKLYGWDAATKSVKQLEDWQSFDVK